VGAGQNYFGSPFLVGKGTDQLFPYWLCSFIIFLSELISFFPSLSSFQKGTDQLFSTSAERTDQLFPFSHSLAKGD